MDSEIRAIMAQYMPLDNQGDVPNHSRHIEMWRVEQLAYEEDEDLRKLTRGLHRHLWQDVYNRNDPCVVCNARSSCKLVLRRWFCACVILVTGY
jgi:hypothetical protein